MSEDLGKLTGYSCTVTLYDTKGKVVSSEKIEVKLDA